MGLMWLLRWSYTGRFAANRWEQLNDSWHRGEDALLRVFAFFAADVALGAIAVRCLKEAFREGEATEEARFGNGLLSANDYVVVYLRRLMEWVMGAPAGLKLNSALSQNLGKFFLYHLRLWRTFLLVIAPYVSRGFCFGLRSGLLSVVGLGFQVCLAQDALNLVTFHIHCFYSYARRIFLSQTSGLRSLWRLFRGLKYNPLRNRVDSMPNTVEQLFVGTVGFTILLFLYPTTLVYFVIFAMLECCVNAVNFALDSFIAGISVAGDKAFTLKVVTVDHLGCWKS